MIRKTLKQTRNSTFSVLLPNEQKQGLPTPIGTGFFVSPDGWFVTAAHVVTTDNRSNGKPRPDIDDMRLEQEDRFRTDNPPDDFREALNTGAYGSAGCQHVSLDYIDPATDFALLKVDFAAHRKQVWLRGEEGFPFLTVSRRILEEAEPVYAFGYPLSDSLLLSDEASLKLGHVSLCPRTTSAIISATLERTRMVSDPTAPPDFYVLDKALNYGNSGGPIVSVDTGHVHAFCSRFQPVFVPQPHLSRSGNQIAVCVPSLYGIVSNISQDRILEMLKQRAIPIADE